MSIKDNKNTDFRLQYLVQSFKSISRKPFETYVIQRIWHRLGDDRVQFVFQQYVNRGEKDKYALADLYLPQVKMVVEVNEKYHYTTEEQRERDRLRNAEVAKRGKVDVRVVNCDQPLEAVHKEIDKVVDEIRSRIKNLGDKFVPWDGYVLHDAKYYKKKGCLNVDDNIYVQTIDDACDIFGIKAKHKGFLRAAGADIDDKTMLWAPDTNNRLWSNELSEDGNFIEEYPRNDKVNPTHLFNALSKPDHKRVVFFRQRDDFGLNLYRFVGVFMLDVERTKKENHTIWKKMSNNYKL
ncbi:MAG: hypothetical protein IJK99_04945 [Bacteroidales bacterium]|nr:hypothetical protein [Bacteroidales bacterium]